LYATVLLIALLCCAAIPEHNSSAISSIVRASASAHAGGASPSPGDTRRPFPHRRPRLQLAHP